MFKSFAASLLPLAALARGDNDGSSWDNASEMSFTFKDQPGVVVTLQHYNKSEGTEENVFEFHGDTQFTSKDGHYSNIRYGWCVSLPNTVVDKVETLNWDCQTVQTSVDPLQNPFDKEKGVYGVYDSQFEELTDGIWTGAAADFTTAKQDDSISTDPENSWFISKTKSHKRCQEDATSSGVVAFTKGQDPKSNFVTCPAAPSPAVEGDTKKYGVDMHFFRNFNTASDQDMKLMLDAEPAAEDAEPAAEDAKPAAEDAEPAAEDAKPAAEDAEPAAEDAEPAVEDAEPAAELKIFAFAQTFLKTDFTADVGGKLFNREWVAVSDVQTFSPVSAVFKKNVEVAAAQQAKEDAAQKVVDEAAEAKQVTDDAAAKKVKDDAAAAAKKEADATKEDGAMQITAHATAVLAAVYALAM